MHRVVHRVKFSEQSGVSNIEPKRHTNSVLPDAALHHCASAWLDDGEGLAPALHLFIARPRQRPVNRYFCGIERVRNRRSALVVALSMLQLKIVLLVDCEVDKGLATSKDCVNGGVVGGLWHKDGRVKLRRA